MIMTGYMIRSKPGKFKQTEADEVIDSIEVIWRKKSSSAKYLCLAISFLC